MGQKIHIISSGLNFCHVRTEEDQNSFKPIKVNKRPECIVCTVLGTLLMLIEISPAQMCWNFPHHQP